MTKKHSLIYNIQLREERLRHNWSQQELADRIGTTTVTINRWERGVTRPSPHFRLKLCELFGKSADELGLFPEYEDDKAGQQVELQNLPLNHEETILSQPSSPVPASETNPPAMSLPGQEHFAMPMKRAERQRMLNKVYTFWIKGIFEQSLYKATLIALGLQTTPDAVVNPWSLVVQSAHKTRSMLPPDTRMLEVYDEMGGELLLLGEPGCGKTTLLLELTRDLLERATHDETHPVPVVFNLSSWSEKQLPLALWLVEELANKYQVPRKLGQLWIERDCILPLLDGLDEVASKYCSDCVDAINAYRQEHGLLPMVVCSRSSDYFQQTKRILLGSAVTVQPLTQAQIDEYLLKLGEQMSALRLALSNDSILRDLATTPLMLNVLTLAYHDRIEGELSAPLPLEERKEQIFSLYIERVLHRRGVHPLYMAEKTVVWLSRLAQQITRQGQTIFYIEHMQSDWLPQGNAQRSYDFLAVRFLMVIMGALLCFSIGTAMFGPDNVRELLNAGSIYVLLGGLIGGWFSRGKNTSGLLISRNGSIGSRLKYYFVKTSYLRNGLIVGSLFGSLFGLTGQFLHLSYPFEFESGILWGLTASLMSVIGRNRTIQSAELVIWSWRQMGHHLIKVTHLRNSLLVGMSIGLLLGSSPYGHRTTFIDSFIHVLILVSMGLLCYWLCIGIFHGLSHQIFSEQERTKPNIGIRRSSRYCLFIGVNSGCVVWFIYTFLCMFTVLMIERMVTKSPVPILEFIRENIVYIGRNGLIIGVTVGLLLGLLNGGIACLRHLLLRFLLWRAGVIPWNYPQFLDYAAENMLLRKVGGGYIFIHRLIRDYFASLDKSSLLE